MDVEVEGVYDFGLELEEELEEVGMAVAEEDDEA